MFSSTNPFLVDTFEKNQSPDLRSGDFVVDVLELEGALGTVLCSICFHGHDVR